MKVIILNGSPRIKGNTRILLKEFESGCIDNMEGTNIEFIDLSNKSVKPCEACDACQKTAVCIHKDDTNTLMKSLTEADTIIFGTPVYWWGMSAQLKTMVDKFYTWQGLDYKVPDKQIGIITVGGAAVGDEQYKLISDQFKCISNFLKWDIRFDESFSAYDAGEILDDHDALKKVESLYKVFN